MNYSFYEKLLRMTRFFCFSCEDATSLSLQPLKPLAAVTRVHGLVALAQEHAAICKP